MLRDDRQVALGDVLVALQEAADCHEHVAAHLGERGQGPFLDQLVGRNRDRARRLADDLRALGDRPREADTEYETVLEVMSDLKAALAEDDVASMHEDRARAEEKVEAMAAVALEQEGLGDEVIALLREIRAGAHEAQARLRNAPA